MIETGREVISTPERPTAIFAANADSAADVMPAIAQSGLIKRNGQTGQFAAVEVNYVLLVRESIAPPQTLS